MDEKQILIRAEGIIKTFSTKGNRLKVLESISLSVLEGEFIAFVGPSGCGKTTFLRIIAEIEKPDDGKVVWPTDLGDKKNRLSFTFQHLALFPWRTVEKNIGFPLEGEVQISDIQAKVADAIKAFGLQDFEKFYPSQLSGGMRQRVALARALITEPKVLILDEPFGALDVNARLKLQDLILRTCGQRSISVVMVTHDLNEAVRLCDRVIVLSPRPAKIVTEIEIEQWSKNERLQVTPAKTAPYVEQLQRILRKADKQI